MHQRKGETKEEFRARDNAARTARRKKNWEAFLEYERTRYAKDPVGRRAKHKTWRDKNRDHVNERARAINKTEARRKYIREYRREEYQNDPVAREKAKARTRRYTADGRGKLKHQERLKNNPIYAMGCRIRVRIAMALRKAKKGTRKHTTTIKLLGCSFAEFKKHLEALFTGGMTWEKVMSGEIHIDHIKPISSFDLTDPLQQKAAFHFTNCQPLWAADNISKGNKIIPFRQAA